MQEMTRRSWLATCGLAPAVGGLAAWAEGKRPAAFRPKLTLTPRERMQRRHLPDVELITHEGRRLHFYQDLVKDKKVVLNFMYAECQGICVPVTANLVKVQRMLGDRVGRDIFFYSITLKPSEDSPNDLKHYAHMHGVERGWLFLTGEVENVELLRRSLGFAYADPAEDADKSNHIGMLRHGVEATMRWGAVPALANPEHILRTILWDLDAPDLSRSI
jgi:protein SCO1/2